MIRTLVLEPGDLQIFIDRYLLHSVLPMHVRRAGLRNDRLFD